MLKYTTRKVINFTLIIVLALVTALGFTLTFLTLKSSAVRESREKIQIIRDTYLSIHKYFTEELKPSLFALTEAENIDATFNPVWMSSSYAVTRIQNYSIEFQNQGFSYKHVAINARNPEREADPEEVEFLHELNTPGGQRTREFFAKKEGQFYFFSFNKGETIEPACLKCHGEPADAPLGLTEIYGSLRAFHRQVGEVVSADIIEIPQAALLRNYILVFGVFAFIFLFMAFVLTISIRIINQRFILHPLSRIMQQLEFIRDNPLIKPPAFVLQPLGEEFTPLILSLNSMSETIYNSQVNFENLVEKRTRELGKANEVLRKLLREVNHRIGNNFALLVLTIQRKLRNSQCPETYAALKELLGRFELIIEVHRILDVKYEVTHVSAREYFSSLLSRLSQAMIAGENLPCVWEIDDFSLPVRMVEQLGHIVNELLTNAIKYAKRGAGLPGILFLLQHTDSQIRITVTNPVEENKIDSNGVDRHKVASTSLGIQIIESLLADWEGTLVMSPTAEEMKVVITFPFLFKQTD